MFLFVQTDSALFVYTPYLKLTNLGSLKSDLEAVNTDFIDERNLELDDHFIYYDEKRNQTGYYDLHRRVPQVDIVPSLAILLGNDR